MSDDITKELTEVVQRAKSNTHRIEKLEGNFGALHELTIAVREMVIKQDYTNKQMESLNKKIEGIDDRMDAVENKPAKRWESIVEKVILTAVAALVGFVLARVGL